MWPWVVCTCLPVVPRQLYIMIVLIDMIIYYLSIFSILANLCITCLSYSNIQDCKYHGSMRLSVA